MTILQNLTPRLSPLEIILRAEAHERRMRWTGFCILLGTIAGIVLLFVMRRGA